MWNAVCGRRCGIFETGFAGTFYDPAYWRSVLEVTADGNFSTAPLLWPVLYTRGLGEEGDSGNCSGCARLCHMLAAGCVCGAFETSDLGVVLWPN